MNSLNDHCITVCNSLLRGELSAVETYGQAIETHGDEPIADELRRIRGEHAKSAARLSANVREMGGTPGKDSGAWGIFAVAVQGTADIFGATAALSTLQKGEEMGRSDYKDALLDDLVMPDCKQMISEELLPSVMNHIVVLDSLKQSL